MVAPPPAAPAIAAKPPAGPVVAKPPAAGVEVRPPAAAPGMAKPPVTGTAPGTEVRPPVAHAGAVAVPPVQPKPQAPPPVSTQAQRSRGDSYGRLAGFRFDRIGKSVTGYRGPGSASAATTRDHAADWSAPGVSRAASAASGPGSTALQRPAAPRGSHSAGTADL